MATSRAALPYNLTLSPRLVPAASNGMVTGIFLWRAGYGGLRRKFPIGNADTVRGQDNVRRGNLHMLGLRVHPTWRRSPGDTFLTCPCLRGSARSAGPPQPRSRVAGTGSLAYGSGLGSILAQTEFNRSFPTPPALRFPRRIRMMATAMITTTTTRAEGCEPSPAVDRDVPRL